MNLAESYVRIKAWNDVRRADRIALWRWGVPRLKEAFRLFTAADPIDELHARGPNKTGKTLTKAAFVIACLQKRQDLDGVPIPQWRGPVEAIQLVLDYPQQLLSVKPAYLKLLEGWPHRVLRNGEYLSTIRVMPVGGDRDDQTEWSVIHFQSQKNVDTGRGARADIVDFDEPPNMFFLQELRKAGHAGRRSIIVIGETPERMKEWAGIREDYGDTPRRTLRRVDEDRAEVRWSLEEVESWILSDKEKAKMRRNYARDKLKDAREHGDYTNVVGSTPWGEHGILVLLEMMNRCTAPVEEVMRVPLESQSGEAQTVRQVPVKVWKAPEKGNGAYIPIDPASGVDDDKHHEAALLVAETGSGDLCATWSGYLAPWSLGALGAGIGRQYGEAVGNPNPFVDPETMDHWGVNVVSGLKDSRYGAIASGTRLLRPGEWAKEVGFKMDEERKAVIIGRIQEWLAAWEVYFKTEKDGRKTERPYGYCSSREVLQIILDAELDERGKVVAGPGLQHGHFMILWGQALDRAVSRSNREIPTLAERAPSKLAKLRQMMNGDHSERQTVPQYRERPRV